MGNELKTDRVLELFARAMKGEYLSAQSLAKEYGVSSRSISRDITSLKTFLDMHHDLLGNAELVYSSSNHCYHLETSSLLSNMELMAITKILIGCRALSKEKLSQIIKKLKMNTSNKDKALLEKLISNEIYHYAPVFLDHAEVANTLWSISEHISHQRLITVTYTRMDRTTVNHTLKPISIIFSEYYFYLIAYDIEHEDNSLPRYYRLDRITEIIAHREQFRLDASQNVDEGILRNRSQFMWPGKLRRIRFEFSGPSLQAVLDKLPTARIVEKKNKKTIIEAEVYGDGIKMFLLSQGSWIKVLAPQDFVDEMKGEIQKMLNSYE